MKNTKILRVSDKLADDDIRKLSEAAEAIRNGKLVAFPTETVYGLGANALDSDAVKTIFAAKGRPQDNPLIVHLSSAEDIEKYAYASENKLFPLISDLFPAPLTVILKKRGIIPDVVSANLDTVGFRIPLNRIARKLIELSGVPIAAPSANLSGRPSPTKAEHVIEDMMGRADIIIDGGSCDVGVESTIVTLATTLPTLLRPGGISIETLESRLGEVAVSSAVLSEMKSGEVAAAPGMKYRHYAPKAPVVLVIGGSQSAVKYINEKAVGKDCAVLCFDEEKELIKATHVITIGREHDLDAQGRNVFDALRLTDSLDNGKVTEIYARTTGDFHGVGLAVYNRLLKASGFNVVKL